MKEILSFFAIIAVAIVALYQGVVRPHQALELVNERLEAPSANHPTSGTDATVREMAHFLETAPQVKIPSTTAAREVTAGSDPKVASEFFGKSFMDEIESDDIKSSLRHLTPETAVQLAGTLDDRIERAQDASIEERLRLLEVRKWLSEQHGAPGASDFYFKIAQAYFSNESTREADLGRAAFQHYLDQESDPVLKQQKYKQFLSEHGVSFEESGTQ